MTDEEKASQAYAIAIAYRQGFLTGQTALAARHEAMCATWKAAPRLTWEQQVAARTAETDAWIRAQDRDPHAAVPTYDECMASWDEVAA